MSTGSTGLTGRTVVVIGGASGIGWATAQTLAAQGDTVVIADIDAAAAAARADELGAGHRAAAVDVADEASVIALLDGVGPFHGVVNCAGVSTLGLVVDHDAAEFRRVVDVCLTGASQVAALELAARGVRVNAVSPGLVVTPLTAPAMDIPGVRDAYLENTPLGRSGEPAEIAAAIRFLLSDDAAWITGENLDINGGAHLQRYPDLNGLVVKAFG
jgi:NAD(P)-dependent dehydrogenase (short-subunit alcohol dehydrogenase family)